jgi:hypothetical protein
VSFLRQQRSGGHDLSGLAVAALRNLFRDPGFLNRMQTMLGKTFDGDNPLPCRGCNGCLTGAGCCAVDVDSAGSTEPDAAAIFRACHVEQVTEHPEKGHRRIGIHGLFGAVNLEC